MDIDYSTLLPESQRRSEQYTPEGPIGFGKGYTDHDLEIEFVDGAWQTARFVPSESQIPLDPRANVLHYGQGLFEGAKAFLIDDELFTFRLDSNELRMNESAFRLAMADWTNTSGVYKPLLPEGMLVEATHALLDVERLWAPMGEDSSLYIRPYLFGNRGDFHVGPSPSYLLRISLAPSGPYFSNGFSPIDLLITEKFNRAFPGGAGAAKAAGNYAPTILPSKFADQFGCKQVLYRNLISRTVDEAGAMNHFHVENGEIVIPEFTDSILRSVTSESVIELAKSGNLGVPVRQASIGLEDMLDGIATGRITEAGGLGTAASVIPVGSYRVLNDDLVDGDWTQGRLREMLETVVAGGKLDSVDKLVTDYPLSGSNDVAQRMYEVLTGIQNGSIDAPDGWMQKVERVA